jgi:molecular chaperone DnaK
LGDKVDSGTKANVEGISERLKKAMEGNDVEEIKKLTEELMQASHKLAEAMYAQASSAGQPGAEQAAGDEAAGQAQTGAGAAPDDDVVDADFEEVKDDK